MTFLQPALQCHWQAKGFVEPTAIQQRVYEPLLKGESFVAISPTGTGKTLAYLLPLLTKIQANRTLQAIVLAPSQELCKQIATVAMEWADPLSIGVQLIVGGANFKRQQEVLKAKPELIIATPGRLLELIDKSRKLKLHTVTTVVFDEADYLFDAESQSAMQSLQKKLLRDTQYVWFSATYGNPLQQLVQHNALPLYQVDKEAALNIDHYYVLTQNRQKVEQLKRLAYVDGMQAMVFFEQVNQVEEVAAKLLYQRVKVAVLHGQLSKQERELAIRLFRTGQVTYLLTTDMAARGLDIPEVPFVIHYNRVSDVQTYVHRSGRTGRMGKYGQVVSLVNEQELRDLIRLVQKVTPTLEERIIHASQLLKPNEKPATVEKTRQPKAKPTQKVSQQRPTSAKPIKKQKNRKRDTKNKGKRQVKK